MMNYLLEVYRPFKCFVLSEIPGDRQAAASVADSGHGESFSLGSRLSIPKYEADLPNHAITGKCTARESCESLVKIVRIFLKRYCHTPNFRIW